jgi:septal ring factor EnvC (AmiA/AmiB activator)
VLLGVLLSCFVVAVATTRAADPAALKNRIDVARQQAQSLAQKVQSSQDHLAGVEVRAKAAAARESDLSAQLTTGRERYSDVNSQLNQGEARLRVLQGQLNRALRVLEKRLVGIYKSGAPDATNVILDADGFDDLVTRTEYLNLIEDSDSALARRVRSLRDEYESQVVSLRKLRAQAAAYNSRIAAAQSEIAAARAEAQAQAAALAQARSAAQGSLSDLRGRIGGWEQQLQKAEQINASQARQQIGQWFGNWAIPEAIVMCESGGNLRAVNPSSGAGGAYQILPSTWRAYGGKGRPQDASKAEQDRIAAAIWRDSGPSAWVCKG